MCVCVCVCACIFFVQFSYSFLYICIFYYSFIFSILLFTTMHINIILFTSMHIFFIHSFFAIHFYAHTFNLGVTSLLPWCTAEESVRENRDEIWVLITARPALTQSDTNITFTASVRCTAEPSRAHTHHPHTAGRLYCPSVECFGCAASILWRFTHQHLFTWDDHVSGAEQMLSSPSTNITETLNTHKHGSHLRFSDATCLRVTWESNHTFVLCFIFWK